MFLFNPFFKKTEQSTPITDPSSSKKVITVNDNLEDDGFAKVDIRPFTYAEVASLSVPPGSEVHRIEIPIELNYQEDYEEDQALHNSIHDDDINKPLSDRNPHVLGEFEYGGLVGDLVQSGRYKIKNTRRFQQYWKFKHPIKRYHLMEQQ